MNATLKEMEFMGTAGVGVYINNGLSSFVINATDLLDTINALRDIGYNVVTDKPDWESGILTALFDNGVIDETELEDNAMMDELEDL